MFVHCTHFSHVMKSKTLFNIHLRMIEQKKGLPDRFMVKPHTSDIRMTYEHIRVTYGWHTSTYECHMDDIRVHMNDISMTYEYMRVTYGWHASTYEWHTSTYEWNTNDTRVYTSDIRVTYGRHRELPGFSNSRTFYYNVLKLSYRLWSLNNIVGDPFNILQPGSALIYLFIWFTAKKFISILSLVSIFREVVHSFYKFFLVYVTVNDVNSNNNNNNNNNNKINNNNINNN